MTVIFNFNPPVIAHRGASAYAPENTMIAFNRAMQLGAKWVEFDVMRAACGEAIIFHDDLLDRTTNDTGRIISKPYSVLKALDAGKWFDPRFSGEKIPSFSEMVIWLESNNMSANIEIKTEMQDEKSLIKKIHEQLSHSTLKSELSAETSTGRIIFSSFSVSALTLLREAMPDAPIGLLLHEWEKDWEKTCENLSCVSVHVNEAIMTEAHAYEIKRMGKYLLCYTVNDALRAKKLLKWGVDAVFSDVPDIILNALETTI